MGISNGVSKSWTRRRIASSKGGVDVFTKIPRLRQEAGKHLRVTIISPGIVQTNFTEGVTNKEVRERLTAIRDELAMPPDAVARAIAFAIEQPDDIDVNEIVIRPTAQV